MFVAASQLRRRTAGLIVVCLVPLLAESVTLVQPQEPPEPWQWIDQEDRHACVEAHQTQKYAHEL